VKGALLDRMPAVIWEARRLRVIRFAVIGCVGTIGNVVLMSALVAFGLNYLAASAIAAEVTIIFNFCLQERWVFFDPALPAGRRAMRFVSSFSFNNAEALVRMPLLWLLVERLGVLSPLAQLETILAAFAARYIFHARIVYAPATHGPAEAKTGHGRRTAMRPLGARRRVEPHHGTDIAPAPFPAVDAGGDRDSV
jgi:putative flippase GtrA